MIIAAEITSVLQVLFVLSLIRKICKNKKKISVDFLFLNNYVNDGTIKTVQNLLINYEYTVRYFDYRNQNSKLILDNKTSYDALIIRSRIPIESSSRFIFYRSSFISTGNCNNSKLAQSSLSFERLYTVDDGLSNWEGNDSGYLLNALSNRRAALPIIFSKFIPLGKFVEHFSIFSTTKYYSIMHEFSVTVKDFSSLYDKNYEVEDLFIGIWPAFDDRLSSSNKDCQLDCFSNYLAKNDANYSIKKFFIKEHPKYGLDIESFAAINLERLQEYYANTPFEIIINSFPKLKNIYGFPSTALFLISIVSNKDVNINIFVRKGDDRYFPERAQIIKNFNRNVNLIYI
jgi:hypothetical protein